MTCKCTGGNTVRGDGGLSVGGSVTLRAGGVMFTLGDVGGTVTLGVLFKIHLVVVRLAQLVVVSPGKSNLLPPTVTRT